MIRKVVLGSGLLAFVPQVHAATPVADDPSDVNKPPPMRLEDLPIYEAPHAAYAHCVQKKNARPSHMSAVRKAIKEPVSVVRQQVQAVWHQADGIYTTVHDNYIELKDRSDWIFQYLREEENKGARIGAVAMGGLTGFIFGLRGGIFRRVLYTGIGTTAMGYVCFPEQTSELASQNGALAKQYINIAYNFLYGVKPGDPQLEVKFPELSFPKNLSELTDLAISVASSVRQVVMPPPAKEEGDTKSEKKE